MNDKNKNSTMVDINRAGAEELETLPGIGKALAMRILEFREKNGPFRRVDELLIIRGISEKKLDKIRHRLKVGPVVPEPKKPAAGKQPPK